MPIDERIRTLWAQQIKPRLKAVLLHDIPKGTCVQEFMMAGKRVDAMKPTLIISCGDALMKKKVEKTFKSQGWLQELLKANGIMLVVHVAKTPMSAGPATNSSGSLQLDKYYAVQLLPFDATTSCGQALLANVYTQVQRNCTLGGLLMVNGEILGLTARHPFEAHEAEQEMAHLDVPDAAPYAEHLEKDESSESSDEPFVFNEDNGGSSSASSVSLQEDADFASHLHESSSQGQTNSPSVISSSTEFHPPQLALVPLSTPVDPLPLDDVLGDYDWALLKALPPSVRSQPNKVAYIDSRHDIPIEGVFSELAYGEVTIIIASIGPQLGCLHSSPVTMKIDEAVLDVRLITLERTLRKSFLRSVTQDLTHH